MSLREVEEGIPSPGHTSQSAPARDATQRLVVETARRSGRIAARARPLFDREGAWEAFERDLLALVHGYLLVVSSSLSPRDLERLRGWAAGAWSRVYALVLRPGGALSWPDSFDELPGRLEVREVATAPVLLGSFLITTFKVWFFTGEVADLGRPETFVHEVTEPEPVRERFLSAWETARPVRWGHDPSAMEDAAE